MPSWCPVDWENTIAPYRLSVGCFVPLWRLLDCNGITYMGISKHESTHLLSVQDAGAVSVHVLERLDQALVADAAAAVLDVQLVQRQLQCRVQVVNLWSTVAW